MHSLTLGGRELTLSLLFVFTKVIHTGYPPFACGRWHMGDEDAESEGAVETFGALRLLLKSGTASGYVGVRRVKKSKKRPWQGWVHLKGEKSGAAWDRSEHRRKPQWPGRGRWPAVRRGEFAESPRRQAARSSGAAAP